MAATLERLLGNFLHTDDAATDLADVLLRAGYTIVPVKATDKMHEAARDWSRAKYGKPIGTDASAGCWDAMVAAAQEE